MLLELLEAVKFGKEVGGIAQGLINGDHYDAVDKAFSMCDAIDYNAPTWREEINEILDTISCVNKNDRAFVRAAATYIRACCYFDLGNYAKSRQSISECIMISVDSWTINKESILDCQKSAKELRKKIDKQYNSQEREPELEQIPNPVTPKSYSRQELLDIIAKCNNTSAYYVTEDSILNGSIDDLMYRLENWYNIKVSKSKPYATYRDIIDNILSPNSLAEEEVDIYSLPFSMQVEDIFSIEGRGTVVTGNVASGRLHVGDTIYLTDENVVLSATVTGVEMFRLLLDQCEYGDNVGLLLEGVSVDQVERGMMATTEKPDLPQKQINIHSVPASPSSEEQEYLEEVKSYLEDGEIGPRERKALERHRDRLGISVERAKELESSLVTPSFSDDEIKYLEEVKFVLEDGEIGPRERKSLERHRVRLGISEERAREIENLA